MSLDSFVTDVLDSYTLSFSLVFLWANKEKVTRHQAENCAKERTKLIIIFPLILPSTPQGGTEVPEGEGIKRNYPFG